MIDPTPRRAPAEAVETAEPRSVNDLIQARIDGRLSRRGLLRRAAALGIAAPVVGVILHATSDVAFGAPTRHRRPASTQANETVPVTGPTAPAGKP